MRPLNLQRLLCYFGYHNDSRVIQVHVYPGVLECMCLECLRQWEEGLKWRPRDKK
jgi:hypothetical protein